MSSGGSEGNSDKEDYEGLRIITIKYSEKQREYIDYEYVEIENQTGSTIDVGRVSIVYNDKNEYTFSELELEPGAKIVVRSKEAQESVLETDPPVYIRSAGFGEDSNTSVMEPPGVLTLKSPSGEVIHEKSY